MPTAPPVYRHDGYRSLEQRKADIDSRRKHDLGRVARKRLYDSKEWAQLREAARLRDPFCIDCKEEQRLVPWSDLDHIKDIADGGDALSLDNVAGLCKRHHSIKTARTRAFR